MAKLIILTLYTGLFCNFELYSIMRLTKLVVIAVLSVPVLAMAQFGPKKKDLQQKIDSLKTVVDYQNYEIQTLKAKDSITGFEMRKLSGELKDLKQLMMDQNNRLQAVVNENERLKKEYEEMVKTVEIHEIIIKNVIGDDTLTAADYNDNAFDEASIIEPGDEEPGEELSPAEAAKNFVEFANDFINTVKSEGEAGLKPYLSEEKTFYYLSKPGFMVSVAKIDDVGALSEEIPWKIALEAFNKSKFSFMEGEKPEINCEMADLYNKRGCYGGIEQNFDKISKSLIALKEFSPDDPLYNDENIGQIQNSEKHVMSFIYSTDGNIGFYFIKKEGEWLLYCVDIEDPCSA